MSAGTRAGRQGALVQDQPMQFQKGEVALEKKVETLPIKGSLQVKDKYAHLNVSYDILDFGKTKKKNSKILNI